METYAGLNLFFLWFVPEAAIFLFHFAHQCSPVPATAQSRTRVCTLLPCEVLDKLVPWGVFEKSKTFKAEMNRLKRKDVWSGSRGTDRIF